MLRRFTLLLALGLTGQSLAAPIQVGNRKQLFIDHRFIESSENVTLTVNPPRKYGAVLRSEKPWEKLGPGAKQVMKIGDEFRMYYSAVESFAPRKTFSCLAVSKDGIHWDRPNLGLIEYEGQKETNILPAGGAIFIDPRAPADQRFKAVTWRRRGTPDEQGIFVRTSPDGIHFSKESIWVAPFSPDTSNQMFYDPRIDKYVAYLRSWNPWRKVVYCAVDDPMKPWLYDKSVKPFHLWGPDQAPVPSSEMATAITYDEQDPPITDVYTPTVFQYPWAEDVYVALPAMYRHFPEPPDGPYDNDGLLDIHLAVSRDGATFTRPSRQPYIGLGPVGSLEAGQLYMAGGALRVGDGIYQYYTGYRFTHGEYVDKKGLEDEGATFLAVQRLDGYMSADGGFGGGTLRTPLLTFSGRELVLNVDCSALGEAQVEIFDEAGLPIPGYTMSDCDLIQRNHIAKVVTYKGCSDLSALAGKPIRLRFRLRSAKLYAFQFADDSTKP